jgi:hypothetical protein
MLQHIPCGPAFDGSGLGVAVTRCPARPSFEMLQPDKMRTNPFTSYGPLQLNACHQALLAYAETVKEKLLPEPYPQKHVRPLMAFVSSEITFHGTFLPASRVIRVNSGPHSGKAFTQLDRPTHWLLVLDKVSRKTRRKERRAHENEAKSLITSSAVSNSELRCIGCGESEIDADGFVLCFYCNSCGMGNFLGSRQHLDFGKETRRASVRKNSGFQDDEQASAAFQFPLLDKPHSDADRPLDEIELAWILAAKYEGFTVRGTKAHKKARRAAAQLAGHYVLGKSFAEIAKVVDGKENSVNRFCKRSRKTYAEEMVRGPMPEEVRTALASGMLRELYPPAVTTGYLVRSA